MKERKHKWGKRNKARIAAGLPPVTQQTPLHTARFYRSERPSGLQTTANAIRGDDSGGRY